MKKATIFIKGGFGNQLFQFSFAEFLRQKNFIVEVNTELFNLIENDTPRELVLPIEYFGLKEQNYLSKKKFEYFFKLNTSGLVRDSFLRQLFREYKFIKENDNFLESKDKNFFFNGYWKNMEYIIENKNFLITSLSKNKKIKKEYDADHKENFAMIHVRRGDFLKDDRELKISYYEESMKAFRKKNPSIKFDIFTDDEIWVKNQKIFSSVEDVYGQVGGKNTDLNNIDIDGKDDKEETIATFSKMLNYKNFIAGNSSFAFWAAFIRSDSSSLVSVPNPWFRNNSHPTLKKDNWFEIKNY